MIQYLFSLLPVALPIAVLIVLIVALIVLYILARILFSSDTASGIVSGAFYGILIGIIVGLVCVYISAGSLAKMFFTSISWMPFVYGMGATVLFCSILGGVKK